MIKAKNVRKYFDYNPDTGELRWKPRGGSAHGDKVFDAQFAGKIAGRLSRKGYVEVFMLNKEKHPARKLAWAWMTGKWPNHQIDHINHVRNDNRWVNLREATNAQNQQNRKYVSGLSGFKGVNFDVCRGMWRAAIWVRRRRTFLGYFNQEENAALAYNFAAYEFFGEFACFNK